MRRRLAAAARRLTRRRSPSYRALLAEVQAERAARSAAGDVDPLLHLEDKLEAYRVAASLGLAHPEVLARPGSVDDLDWAGLPETFVLKSVGGASARGVWPLERADGGYRHVLTGEVATPADIAARYHALLDQRRIRRQAFVEERLPGEAGPVPIDWKLSCFDGEVVLLMGKDLRGSLRRRDWRFRFLGPDGADLGEVRDDVAIDPALPDPPHLEALVAAGERLSAALARPFVRLDFYDLPDRGVLFGEVTPHPGGEQRYRDDLDAALGAAWQRAARRVAKRTAREGADPLAALVRPVDPGWEDPAGA